MGIPDGKKTIPKMVIGGVGGGDKYKVIDQIIFKCPNMGDEDEFHFEK